MPIIDIAVPKRVAMALRLPVNDFARQQEKVLKKLLAKARFTQFGRAYDFGRLLTEKPVAKAFQATVPTFNYNSIHAAWWHKTQAGEADVCWPGVTRYFALSSGTSEASSKYIPITNDLLKGNKVAMIRHLLSLRNYGGVPIKNLGKAWLAIGGSTDLKKEGGYMAGDLSGITVKKSPVWFQPFYKPGQRIAREPDWHKKLEEIVRKAPEWDISFLVGVPAWIQMVMEMVVQRYQLKSIHDIWPNLTFYVHGGVSFEPYKKGFEKLLGKPLIYIETYLASEGFLAYQNRQDAPGMKLVLNQHIFFEFVPFNEENFDADGNLVPHCKALLMNEVEQGKEYALLISTSAGTWRYLIGDTIRFVDLERAEIVITGRTKHFLSLVGEHLSVENMNRAIKLAQDDLNIDIPEYTVAGVPEGSFFAHQWYVACDDAADARALEASIDGHLRRLNDDYEVERNNALKGMHVKILPERVFNDFMGSKGKLGGQHKFPRVIKGQMLADWQLFIQQAGF